MRDPTCVTVHFSNFRISEYIVRMDFTCEIFVKILTRSKKKKESLIGACKDIIGMGHMK